MHEKVAIIEGGLDVKQKLDYAQALFVEICSTSR